MRRTLLISLSLVLALAGWTTVGADDGFYVISGLKRNYAPVPKTGQTVSYDPAQNKVDDGALQKGVASPTPRFTDNNNGTVTDKLTGLIWMQNANAFGQRIWAEALSDANDLKSGDHGLTDGSQAGDWRLPNVRELQSLIDYGRYNPPVPAVNPFTNVQSSYYWSSTTNASLTTNAWGVGFYDGYMNSNDKSLSNYVWCVRDGK
jgi:hypothetical protein